MQTFLCYPNFLVSAQCLDDRRLNNQINEAKVIIRVLSGEIDSWKNHPCVRMWNGYLNALKYYRNCCILEWTYSRNKNNNRELESFEGVVTFPHWLYDSRLYLSHRSNLLRKNPTYYSQFNWQVPDNLPYFWPK